MSFNRRSGVVAALQPRAEISQRLRRKPKLTRYHSLMASSETQTQRNFTNVKFEVFIAALTVLPFFVLAYFYSQLPDRVPLFLNLTGEVETWAPKTLISVFRVPLMGVAMQIVFLLMKHGTLQSATSLEVASEQAKLHERYLRHNVGLWDFFRFAAAIKMSSESVNTIFLSLERFKFLAQPTFIFSAIVSLIGALGALFCLYRLLMVWRNLKARFGDAFKPRPVDQQHVYGRVVYFNPSDPNFFVNKYLLNFANKWTWLLIACILSYPLLVFLPY